MSETDSFIQEVTEEVRQDQMFAFWKKWGPFVIGGVVIVVGAAALWSWQQSQQRAAAEALGGSFIAAEPTSPEDMVALADRVEGPARVLAQMSAAAALASDGQIADAASRYRSVAQSASAGTEYRELALLQALRLEAIEGDSARVIADLAPLADGDGPFRLLAGELRAAVMMRAGQIDQARAALDALGRDPEATDMLRLRVTEMLNLSGGPVGDPAQ